MRALRTAGLYRSASAEHGRPDLAADEDALTLAATALERAGVRSDPAGPAIPLDLVGAFPTELEWALPALVGGPVELLRTGAGARALSDALQRARAAVGGSAVVVAVSEDEAAAAAFAFEEGAGASVDRFPDFAGSPLTLFEAAAALRRELAEPEGPVWVGDWDPTPSRRPASEPTPRLPVRPAVSEGAYVPRARYLENLPSRWRFVAEVCGTCGAVTFPVRRRCRECGRTEGLTERELPTSGIRVLATTVIGAGGQPTEFDAQVEARGPYAVVLAEMVPGARVTLMVAEGYAGELAIGDAVDTQLRRLYLTEGEWRYGRKAVPARPPVRSR